MSLGGHEELGFLEYRYGWRNQPVRLSPQALQTELMSRLRQLEHVYLIEPLISLIPVILSLRAQSGFEKGQMT